MSTELGMQATNFDYSIVDNDTASFLSDKEKAIKTIIVDSATEIGKHLKEAQDKLAGSNQYDGVFQKWISETFNFSQRTAYRLIERYDFALANLARPNDYEVFENLPKSLSYEISKPSAPKDLVELTLNGDIKTHKEYKELEEELRSMTARAKTLGSRLDEKDVEIRTKNTMIDHLVRKPEKVVYQDNPELMEQLNNANTRIHQAEHKLAQLQDLQAKKHEIEEIYRQIEELKKKRSEFQRDIDENKKIFDFIDKTKKFIKEEMLHIPTLTTHYNQSATMRQEVKMITDLLDNLNFSLKQKFGV